MVRLLAYTVCCWCQMSGIALPTQSTEPSLDEVSWLQGASPIKKAIALDETQLSDCGGTYEAEDASRIINASVDQRHWGFSGSGFVDLRDSPEGAIEWSVPSCAGGAHILNFRYALKSGNRPLQLLVNGVSRADQLGFPSTGSWKTWQDASHEVNLEAGSNTITLQATGASGAIVDSLRVFPQDEQSPQPVYVLLIDAGSSGSRLRIFMRAEDGHSLEQIAVADEDEESFETEPGLSAFVSDVDGAGPSLAGMLQAAQRYVPEEHQAEASLFVQATAGMRLLPGSQSGGILEAVRNYLAQPAHTPFRFRSAEMISGEREGLFSYMSINSLLGRVGAENEVGILELGGASSQVAFKTSHDIRANEFHYYWDGVRHDLYTSSYMRFGADQILLRSKQALLAASTSEVLEVTHPCFHTGFSEETELQGRIVTFVGSSNSSECSQLMLGLLHTEYECMMEPCAIMGNHMAEHDRDFYAISAFFYTANGLGLLGWNDATIVEPRQIQDSTSHFCALSWDEAQAASFSPPRFVKNYCAIGNYMTHLLHAYGFSADSRKITFSRKIDGHNADWTLGAALYELEQMPLTLEDAAHCNSR